uniref:(California timema) hypothetical protein n=1 Tax=Timema californicum TaxID=61474 RepID=A0A7R9PD27_TIMCA|nr:unnamed protein product [Timema californicum]
MDGVKCYLEELLVSFARALEKTIEKEISLSSQVAEEEWEVIRPSKADRRRTLLDLIKRDLSVSGRCGNCTCWRLKAGDTWSVGAHSLGQDLLQVGWWRPRSGLQLTDHVFPNLSILHGKYSPTTRVGMSITMVSSLRSSTNWQKDLTSGSNHKDSEASATIQAASDERYHIVLASNNQDGLSNVTRPDLKEALGLNPDLSLINIPWENIVTAVQQKKVTLYFLSHPGAGNHITGYLQLMKVMSYISEQKKVAWVVQAAQNSGASKFT